MVLAQKHIYRSTEQNREPKTNLHTYGQIIYGKEGNNQQWGKDSIFKK